MEEFKGTPGPWFWERNVLCNKDYIVGGSHHEFNTSNRQLIAASPELLEALQEIVGALGVMVPDPDSCAEIIKSRAAIAKALGK